MAKKKRKDYCYCFICGKAKTKPNFSRLSCFKHICNSCSRLPENKRNREVIKTKLMNVISSYNTPKGAWDFFKDQLNSPDPEIRNFALELYNQKKKKSIF